MKKLLALLLLSPLVSGEELEYPIKLTCEYSQHAMYLNIENIEYIENKSWWKPLYTKKYSPDFFSSKKFINKQNEIWDVEIDEVLIALQIRRGVWIIINRYTLGAQIGNQDGQCFKGFKEYNEKQI